VPRRRPCPRQAARRVPRDRSRRQSPLLRPPRRLRTQRSRCRNRYRGFVRPLRYAPARADVGRLVHDMVSRARRTRGPCGCTPESGAGKPPRDSTAGRMARRLHALSPTPPPRSILCRGYNPKGNGPHDSDISTAPRVDLERLDGLSTRVAGEGPRGVRPSTVPVEGALERRELLRPHRPEHLGAPLNPPGDGTGHRGAEARIVVEQARRAYSVITKYAFAGRSAARALDLAVPVDYPS